MIGTFACPECGSAVSPRGNTPGRRVRCEECGTLVEVPFLPRNVGGRRRASRYGPGWTWAALGTIAAVLMVVGAVQIARSRAKAVRGQELAALVQEAEQAESSGRFGEALEKAESARGVARSLDGKARETTRTLRDRLAVKDAEAQLAASEAMPDRVEALRSLRARVDGDNALEPVRPQVLDALSAALARRAETDLAEASRALDSGHPEMAMNLCERVARAADELGYERAGGVKDAARGVAAGIIGRFGVVFEPVTGEFLQGPSTARVHAEGLQPIIATSLKAHGFLPKPAKSAFLSAWDESAPFRVAIKVDERNDGNFFQTPLHTSRLLGHVVLKRGKAVLWQSYPQGKTRVPPPSMTAFEQSHLSVAKTRDPAVERRLYDDARAVLAENLGTMLRTLPGPPSS